MVDEGVEELDSKCKNSSLNGVVKEVRETRDQLQSHGPAGGDMREVVKRGAAVNDGETGLDDHVVELLEQPALSVAISLVKVDEVVLIILQSLRLRLAQPDLDELVGVEDDALDDLLTW